MGLSSVRALGCFAFPFWLTAIELSTGVTSCVLTTLSPRVIVYTQSLNRSLLTSPPVEGVQLGLSPTRYENVVQPV